MKKVTVQVPATSANCGPGFDTLGLACTLYNTTTYEVSEGRGFQLEVTGEGAGLLKPYGRNLAFASFLKVWNQITDNRRIRLKVTMHNNIPLSRGLGSSSSAIVAGLFAANTLCGDPYSKEQLLDFATEIEGHPDNVAPAIYGGFTISCMDQGKVYALRLLPPKALKFIAVIPERKVSTALARQAIPANISHKDAVYNTSRAALLVGALLSGNLQYLGVAMGDKLHQPYRAHLIPGLEDVFDAGRKAGAYNVIISGSGSTVMAYASFKADCEAIAHAMMQAFIAKGEPCSYRILDLDPEGVRKI